MAVFQGFSLKSKILIGLLFTASLAATAALFSVYKLYHLESRMRQLNLREVPLLKVLSQIENHQYLYDHELARALESGGMKPDPFHANMMSRKLESVNRLYAEERPADPAVTELRELSTQFKMFTKAVTQTFSGEDPRLVGESYSGARAGFKAGLRKAIRQIDRRIQSASFSVQKSISRTVSLVAALLALFLLSAAGLVLWTDKLLSPLQRLTAIVKRISRSGLSGNDVKEMQQLAVSDDEIGVFNREFRNMALSLLERNRELMQERANLEEAHRTLGQQNEDLLKTRAKLVHQEKLALVGKLSAQMAHEIRNPLNALRLHLDTLEFEVDQPSEGFQDIMKCMQSEILRLSSITNSYLDLARTPAIDREPCDLNELIQETEELYRPLLQEKQVGMHFRLSSLPEVNVDKKHLKLVLGNLVRNSCEALAATDGERNRWIVVSTRVSEESGVELVFSDNGSGIDGKDSDSVFSPFFTTKATGTGLGLSHSKQIIDAHGGEITFRSERNVGTNFYITLPLNKGGINESVSRSHTAGR